MEIKMSGLVVFEKALNEAVKTHKDDSFSKLILACRDALGMKQYRAAEFIGISQQRLARLETGFYRDLPSPNEFEGLTRLYNLDKNLLEEKAKEHVFNVIQARKVRVIHDPEEM